MGRPKKNYTESYYEKRKRKRETAERNRIEGKFGQVKNGYDLNKIRARLKNISESWIAAIFFIKNFIHFDKVGIFLLKFQDSLKSLWVFVTYMAMLREPRMQISSLGHLIGISRKELTNFYFMWVLTFSANSMCLCYGQVKNRKGYKGLTTQYDRKY